MIRGSPPRMKMTAMTWGQPIAAAGPSLKQELLLSRHDPRLATSDENDGYDSGQPIAVAGPFV